MVWLCFLLFVTSVHAWLHPIHLRHKKVGFNYSEHSQDEQTQFWVTVDPKVLSTDEEIQRYTNCTAIPHKLNGVTFQCIARNANTLRRSHKGIRRVIPVSPSDKYDPRALQHAEGGVKILLLPSLAINVEALKHKWNKKYKGYRFQRVGEWVITALDPGVHKKGHIFARKAPRGRVPNMLIRSLAQEPGIYWIQPFAAPRLSNSYAVPVVLGNLAQTNFADGGHDELITIADTGLDYRHCDIDAHNVPKTRLTIEHGEIPRPPIMNQNSKVPAYLSYVFNDDDIGHLTTDYMDSDGGHGTHVTATAAGKHGMAPKAKIIFLDLGFQDGTGQPVLYTPHDINIHFFEHIRKYTSSRIFSISWGIDINEYTDNARMIDAFIHHNPDFNIIIATGNGGNDGLGTIGAPATAKNSISVGSSCSQQAAYRHYAMTPSLWIDEGYQYPFQSSAEFHSDAVAQFSSSGPTNDGRLGVDVIAPGTPIASARANHGCDKMIRHGTSMSAPLISGLIARYRSLIPSLTASSLRAIITCTATKPTSVVKFMDQGVNRAGKIQPIISSFTPSPFQYGYGIARAADLDKLEIIETDISHGETLVYEYKSDTTSNIVLAWTDPPSSPNARRMLVNNLDLDVLIDGKQRIYGNHDFNEIIGPDSLNNAEKIWTLPPRANIQIFVRGSTIVTGQQTFSLVIETSSPVIQTIYDSTCSANMAPEPCMLPLGGGVRECNGTTWSNICSLEYCKSDYIFNGVNCVEGDSLMCYGHETTERTHKCAVHNGEGHWCTILSRCAITRCDVGFHPRGAQCVCDRTVNKLCLNSKSAPQETDEQRQEHELVGKDADDHHHPLVILIPVIFCVMSIILIYEAIMSPRFSYRRHVVHGEQLKESLLPKEKKLSRKPVGYRIFPKLA